MAIFKFETKNNVAIDKKPRVYFTCHPEDFEKYFKKVCNDIFKTHDCVIYYTENMTEMITDDEKQVDLVRNNLFVVPVTFKLLSTPNRAMDEEIPYALKEHIPVLPIMMEPGIDEFYSKPDKFGELQYLNPYSIDLTEISYEEKLKKYLESVLISDELAKRVRAAFAAYIFLSYRKKDRKYANELMRLIHSIPECRDIAIWFDEFLTPGESFKENIEKILDDCKLFTLLVTPQLLEKVVDKNGEERDNYVISTELPLARKKKEEKGTSIFAVEMEDTDKDALSEISIEDCVKFNDSQFRARLLDAIFRIAVTTDNSPEHNFLIGLAYLEGIDVETDRTKGVSIIKGVADNGLEEAIRKMISIYVTGDGVNRSYYHAREWFERLLLHKKPQSDSVDGIISYMEVCDAYCDFLEKYFLVEYACFVNDRMLPYAKVYVDINDSVYSDERQNAMLFWLCKSYYRSVHADMMRDADDHNAEWYGEQIKRYIPFIKNDNHACTINECLEFIEKAKSFWQDIDKVISANQEKDEELQIEESVDEMLLSVAGCEEKYEDSPSEDAAEKLIEAYSNVMDYYEKRRDPVNYPKYTLSYLAIKTEQFQSDPDVLEGLDIVWRYDELVDFLIQNKQHEDALRVLKQYIVFLEYLLEIGANCECDCLEAYTRLSFLYEKTGEYELAADAKEKAKKYQ